MFICKGNILWMQAALILLKKLLNDHGTDPAITRLLLRNLFDPLGMMTSTHAHNLSRWVVHLDADLRSIGWKQVWRSHIPISLILAQQEYKREEMSDILRKSDTFREKCSAKAYSPNFCAFGRFATARDMAPQRRTNGLDNGKNFTTGYVTSNNWLPSSLMHQIRHSWKQQPTPIRGRHSVCAVLLIGQKT